eukprot:UN06237
MNFQLSLETVDKFGQKARILEMKMTMESEKRASLCPGMI